MTVWELIQADSFTRQQRSGEDIYITCKTRDDFIRYFAVYDGHGFPHQMQPGHIAYTLAHGFNKVNPLHSYINDEIRNIKPISSNISLIKSGIKEACHKFDLDAKKHDCFGGSCAAFMIIVGGTILLSCHIGDSRLIIWNDTSLYFTTEDHNCFNKKEADRIIRLGGEIKDNRVNGEITVTRAFGDFHLKQYLSVEPQIFSLSVETSTQLDFLITSDALFESGRRDSKYYVDMINIRKKMELSNKISMSKELVNDAIKISNDDATVIYHQYIFRFLSPRKSTESKHNVMNNSKYTSNPVEKIIPPGTYDDQTRRIFYETPILIKTSQPVLSRRMYHNIQSYRQTKDKEKIDYLSRRDYKSKQRVNDEKKYQYEVPSKIRTKEVASYQKLNIQKHTH